MKLKNLLDNWREFDSESPILGIVVQSVFTAGLLILFASIFDERMDIGVDYQFKLLLAILALAIIYLSPIYLFIKKLIGVIIAVSLPIGIVWFVFWSILRLVEIISQAYSSQNY